MRLAIQLAKQLKGQTTPNPPVGAVVLKNGEIVGLGAHLTYGEAHAEVIALDMAGKKAKGATLYVTLEPCSHMGKTAPCADYIIQHQIKRVVIACKDQNEKVAGRGIEKLKQAGIEVEVGCLQEEAMELYDVFFHYISTNYPYVTLKTAISLDGKTATAAFESKWITNETARLDAHQYRHSHDAILVGVNTVLRDNPRLTTRVPGGKNPLRVILDTHLRTPTEANVVTDNQAETWIFVGSAVPAQKIETFSIKKFVRIIKMGSETIDVRQVLQHLAKQNISSVFVEGGATVNGSFLRERLVNQLIIYMAPIVIGGERAPNACSGEGFNHLTDALQLQIKEVDLLDGQMKIIATKEEPDVYRDC